MASHVPCKSLLSVARILLAFLYTPLRHVAFMPLRCNELVSSKFQKLAFKKIQNRKPLIGNVVRVRRVYQLRVGLGWVAGICIIYQVNRVLSGIEILIGYSSSISLISYIFQCIISYLIIYSQSNMSLVDRFTS